MLVPLFQLPTGWVAHQRFSVSQQLRVAQMTTACTDITIGRRHPLDHVQSLPLPPRYGATPDESRQHMQQWKKSITTLPNAPNRWHKEGGRG